ncbi:hypothetical protein K4L06_13890 [Lysobacter sp. BMK333-48F3]|uniref:hypothetical protein n=1 Tax=Lysobacter sp. BMK333-48F3 TaxID=2867962 RepID=UPI001C8C58C5|nr:hypothetical protein [Lysobacter sp. BMK333-48F3]MBX9402402.1 hypothetical protein [Lysobacter sp. BMK333-48F3]
MMRKLPTSLLAVALLAGAPLLAQAESQYSTGSATPLTAAAKLDFQITIPKILFLRVGSGADYTTTATVNQIAFAVPAANVGNGAAVTATATSGDLGNGEVTAKVVGNNGNITLGATALGALSNGAAGDTISYSQIATASDTAALPAPTLTDGASAPLTIAPASGKVVNRSARWTYTYLNNNVVAPGVYGGVNANNSRVTYTASMP